MKKFKSPRFLRNAAFSLLGLGLLGANPGSCENWQTTLEDKIVEKSYTREQAEVGAAEGLKRVFTEKIEKDDGAVAYKLNYDVVKDSEILQIVEEMYDDIKEMLEIRGNIHWLKYLKNTGEGEHLQKQEKIYKYHLDVLRNKVLHRKFEELIGQSSRDDSYLYSPYSSPKNQFKVKEEEKYSLATVFPLNREKKEFDANYIKKARERGDFKDSKKKVEEILTRYEFFEKVPNPQYVVDYGENKWLFKKRVAGLKIIAYSLDDNKDKKADYIEVFRLKKEETSESKPAVKIFKSSGSNSLDVIVADCDFEGEGGYGMPDYVGRHYFIKTARDLMEYSELLDFIFQKKKEEEKREWPELKEMNKLYIAKVGTLPMAHYDCKNGCWDRFLPEYKTGPGGKQNIFTVHIKRDIIGKDIIDNLDEEDKAHMKFSLKWIALQYGGGSRVVEFYEPKKEFRNKKFSVNVSGRNVSLTGEDGQIKSYDVNAITEDKPYQIDFDRNPYKRWEIRDKDGDGKCYECKRERARPEEVIPKK